MRKDNERTTWDGKPIASSPPFGATIVVYRLIGTLPEFLLLHRSHKGPHFEGDWAWTPPSGARYPSEDIVDSARRELLEETGLEGELVPMECEETDWMLFASSAPPDYSIRLSSEHDKYKWVSLDRALAMRKPDVVSQAIRQVNARLCSP